MREEDFKSCLAVEKVPATHLLPVHYQSDNNNAQMGDAA